MYQNVADGHGRPCESILLEIRNHQTLVPLQWKAFLFLAMEKYQSYNLYDFNLKVSTLIRAPILGIFSSFRQLPKSTPLQIFPNLTSGSFCQNTKKDQYISVLFLTFSIRRTFPFCGSSFWKCFQCVLKNKLERPMKNWLIFFIIIIILKSCLKSGVK